MWNIGGGMRGSRHEVKGVISPSLDVDSKIKAYVRLLLVEADDDVMLAGEPNEYLAPFESQLECCHSDDMEYLAATMGLKGCLAEGGERTRDLARAAFRDFPAAMDTVCRHLCVFPYIGYGETKETLRAWDPHERYCKLFEAAKAPTPGELVAFPPGGRSRAWCRPGRLRGRAGSLPCSGAAAPGPARPPPRRQKQAAPRRRRRRARARRAARRTRRPPRCWRRCSRSWRRCSGRCSPHRSGHWSDDGATAARTSGACFSTAEDTIEQSYS